MKQLDLNLIRVFLVLLETKNTRIAGNKLALSQPAVSKALGRLREYFDDELFTRVHSGLKPTPRALELGERLPMIMESLDDVILETQALTLPSIKATSRLRLTVLSRTGLGRVYALVSFKKRRMLKSILLIGALKR